MTISGAPRLLTDGGSVRLRAALKRAEAQGPSEVELETMFESVARTIESADTVVAPCAASPRTWPPAPSLRWRPWIIGMSVALLAGLGGWTLARKQAEHHAEAVRSASSAAESPHPPLAAGEPLFTQTKGPVVGPEEPPQPAPNAPEPRKRRAREASVQPLEEHPQRWLDQSAAENALLVPAVRDLRAQRFDEALARGLEHEQRFPNGALAQTREMLLIEALLMLERRSDALQRAASFRDRFPDSLYREKLDTLLLER